MIAADTDSGNDLGLAECSKCQSVVGDSRFVKDRQAWLELPGRDHKSST
jgi:hypothetical protein